ncbi:metalloregulator ArsR/SmtB family transcription factor [Patulibacter brassicae]|uniref:Metalloregulator ArsR/SmtB family transcription factor n=1 Tax=Patulibacter brassicae TaxID=1705717 RepID=A0ABU4VH80_9ACTN|nr:metalloregulator ArsR/SmtB family transcription factor [Patulibacter brassicae]MDX8150200.1 metalloregulator ArsR/SmtB family transcription factor [Patulibacter brassicae]
MPHPSEHRSLSAPLEREEGDRIAEAMSAFTAPSRVRLLYALVAGESTVEELAVAAEVSATVASQQLRVLRQLGAVAVRRDGRHAFYRLRDHHMADLLAAVRNHAEHDRYSQGTTADVATEGASA